ncbi:Pla a 1-like [Sesbania bispinosa]|nr:Pla a 1-like [Sesbania bispinosa]
MPAFCYNLYEIVCNEAKEDANNCLQVLKADPRITSAKDYRDLSKFILYLAINKAIQGQNYFHNLMYTHPTKAIRQCANFWYSGTIASFRSALRELAEDPESANYDARAAGDGPTSCQRAIMAEGLNNPQIRFRNYQTSLLSNIAFVATNHL